MFRQHKHRRGAFVVIEGCDSSGKSIQSENLVKRLISQNIAVEKRQYPNRDTYIGKILNDYLKKNL